MAVDLPDLDKQFTNSDEFLKGVDTAISRSAKQRFWYGFFQTALLTLVIGLGIYHPYGQKFIGTVDEMIVIFLFAFSVDITVEGALQFKPKPA